MQTDTVLPHFEIKEGIQGVGVFATSEFPTNTTLFVMHGTILKQPTRTSVQIGPSAHIEDELGGKVNHSCHPSAKVNQAERTFVSIKPIKKGEEITFNYCDNEDKMANPFVCRCCNKKISGKT